MILVDSSVWIDYFRGVSLPGDRVPRFPARPRAAAGRGSDPRRSSSRLRIGRGFRKGERAVRRVRIRAAGRKQVCERAARNFRTLRRKGVSVRKTIDTIIATSCIENGYTLLHRDRDFDAFEKTSGIERREGGVARAAVLKQALQDLRAHAPMKSGACTTALLSTPQHAADPQACRYRPHPSSPRRSSRSSAANSARFLRTSRRSATGRFLRRARR